MPIIQTNKPLRPRADFDVYPTPDWTVFSALKLAEEHLRYPPGEILDPGAGDGVWGRIANRFWPMALIEGVELRDVSWPQEYTSWNIYDFLQWPHPDYKFDLIIGNPPYKFATEFCEKSYQLLKSDGVLVFLLRLAFLEGQKRAAGLWKEMPPVEVRVLPRRPSFMSHGRTDATAYALFCWKKGFQGTPKLSWATDGLHAEGR